MFGGSLPDTRGAIIQPILPGRTGFLSAARSVIAGASTTAWFTPGQPVTPQAPAGTEPRRFDYQTGINLGYVPRSEEVITADQLRNMAEIWDLLRAVMETRKDQVVGVPWEIRVMQQPGESNATYKARAKTNPNLKKATQLFECPDGDHLWPGWIRSAMEEMFVGDWWTLYPFKSGGRILVDNIAGDTIKRLLDTEGRTPEPPQPAYQQIIKGVPGHSFTRDQLLYRVKNPRAWKIYGLGPVEQAVITINLAVRRQLWKLNYYTVGNLPEAIAQVPDSWGPDKIKQFQEQFNAMLSGQLDTRRQIIFVPSFGGKEAITFPKQDAIKDEMDEWLARVVCYFFSVSPQPFIKEGMSRFGVQNQAQMSKSEGLLPLLSWIALVLTDLLHRIGWTDLEFVFEEDTESDYLKRAQIQEIRARTGISRIDEIREENGDEPIGVGAGIITANGFVAFPDEEGATAGPSIPPPPGRFLPSDGSAPAPDAPNFGVATRGGPVGASAAVKAAGGSHAFSSRRQQDRQAELEQLLTTYFARVRNQAAARLAHAYAPHAPPVGRAVRKTTVFEPTPPPPPAPLPPGNGNGHSEHGDLTGAVELVKATADAMRPDEALLERIMAGVRAAVGQPLTKADVLELLASQLTKREPVVEHRPELTVAVKTDAPSTDALTEAFVKAAASLPAPQVHVPAPVVHVTPSVPEVKVEAPQVTVQPAPVTVVKQKARKAKRPKVQVDVHVPPPAAPKRTRTRRTIIRDELDPERRVREIVDHHEPEDDGAPGTPET